MSFILKTAGFIIAIFIVFFLIMASYFQYESSQVFNNNPNLEVEKKIKLGTIDSIDGHDIKLKNFESISLKKFKLIERILSRSNDISLEEGDTVYFKKFAVRDAYYLCAKSQCHIISDYSEGIEEKVGKIGNTAQFVIW